MSLRLCLKMRKRQAKDSKEVTYRKYSSNRRPKGQKRPSDTRINGLSNDLSLLAVPYKIQRLQKDLPRNDNKVFVKDSALMVIKTGRT